VHIEWRTHLPLMALHAGWCRATLSDSYQSLGPEFDGAAEELGNFNGLLQVSRDRFWEQAMILAVDQPQVQSFAERMQVQCLPPQLRNPSTCRELAEALRTVFRTCETQLPRFFADMRLRIGPLQQLWEAYGPGLLRILGRMTSPQAIVERAEVFLVQPIVGGHGFPHLVSNRCHLEALLTNSDPQIPETLRLAWLLGQLDLERPIYSQSINSLRLRRIVGLAMVVPTLLAAEQLDLCQVDRALVARALRLWRLASSAVEADAISHLLFAWWETVERTGATWSLALTGLDRMLLDP
jgi:hypothetical protein